MVATFTVLSILLPVGPGMIATLVGYIVDCASLLLRASGNGKPRHLELLLDGICPSFGNLWVGRHKGASILLDHNLQKEKV